MDKENFSYASLANLALIEELHALYLTDSTSLEPSWRAFFEGMHFASQGASQGESPDLRVYHLIEAYRTYGHLRAHFNPLGIESKEPEELSLEKLKFSTQELQTLFPTCGFLKEPEAPLQKILEALQQTYCGKIGIEYMGFGEPALEKWLQKRIEPNFELGLHAQHKIEILHFLNKAELFESFLHTKYVGQKRFSLEGEETFIPLLAKMLEVGASSEVEEIVLGMAHRGRLNVLANIMNKSYAHIFHEFEDVYIPELTEEAGDVKYHKGFEGVLKTSEGSVKIVLAANPSHLESVDPVVEGQVRAKQQKRQGDAKKVVPVLIHGDAAVAGQGVIYETLELCKLTGYATGGTIHIVINNQIGFTTLPKDSRSTRYCTDIAKTVGAPVFHVNAEDPEGCVAVAQIAIEMRQQFQCDVFIDLIGYRKYGHNEGDEPAFTQPMEYKVIREKKNVRELYRDKLIAEGVLTKEKAENLEEEFKKSLHDALESIKQSPPSLTPSVKQEEKGPVHTAVPAEILQTLAKQICTPPQGFTVHPKIQRHLQERLAMLQGGIDWGMGEALCYGTLVDEGVHVRLSGQDSRRGTFSHRHAMWVDPQTAQKYFPLAHIKKDQGLFDVFNSPLSEFSVLGFEFGYTLSYPEALVIWEAQYGDFCNGAQIIIDQYISSSEQKWGQCSGLVLMLPHAYQGEGPEHSSARIERFLQLCGDDNMRIANCTTPAQLFHLLRRQAHAKIKKPLILFTPKSLLRHPQCVSVLSDFSTGSFQEILDDPLSIPEPRRLLFCSGKIFYDLLVEREKCGIKDIAFVRLEQLYPLNQQTLKAFVRNAQEYGWVQEEHKNMGAWSYIQPILHEVLGKPVRYFGRASSGSPAAGSHALHKKQQQVLMEEVFGENRH